MPYLTGDSLPTEVVCGRLFIPNDRQLIANVCGALLELTKAYRWEQFGAVTVAETVAAMLIMVNGFMEDTCEDCAMQLRADPENPCALQQSLDGGGTWETILDTSACGAVGPAGAAGADSTVPGPAGADGADSTVPGPQGPVGDTGPVGPAGNGVPTNGNPTTNATNTTSAMVACGVADGVTQWLYDRFNDELDVIAADIAGGVTLFRTVNKMLDAFLQFTIVGDEAADAITEFVTGAATTGVATVRANDTTAFREAVRCYLYCLLLPRGGDFGTDFDTVIGPFVSEITAGQSPIISVPFTAFIRGIDISAWRQRAVINANNEGECDICTDCPNIVTITSLNSNTIPSGAPFTYGETVSYALDTNSGGYYHDLSFSPAVNLEFVDAFTATSGCGFSHGTNPVTIFHTGGGSEIVASVDAAEILTDVTRIIFSTCGPDISIAYILREHL